MFDQKQEYFSDTFEFSDKFENYFLTKGIEGEGLKVLFSLSCNVFQWVKSKPHFLISDLKGTTRTKVRKCNCQEIRQNNIVFFIVVIMTFRVCEWKTKKRKKYRKSFCAIFASSWSGRGSFSNNRNLVGKKVYERPLCFSDLLVWIESAQNQKDFLLRLDHHQHLLFYF